MFFVREKCFVKKFVLILTNYENILTKSEFIKRSFILTDFEAKNDSKFR